MSAAIEIPLRDTDEVKDLVEICEFERIFEFKDFNFDFITNENFAFKRSLNDNQTNEHEPN
jgi:hypothetical protein